jgi:hypothetical protein
MAAKEMGQLSLIDALTLVACYARTGIPKFDKAAVRSLALAQERDTSLRDIRLAANALEAFANLKHHDLAEKMLLRFLG